MRRAPAAKWNAKRSPGRVSKQGSGFHPVDGNPSRFCGPPGGADPDTEFPCRAVPLAAARNILRNNGGSYTGISTPLAPRNIPLYKGNSPASVQRTQIAGSYYDCSECLQFMRRIACRKGVPANHPPDDSPPLFAHLSGGPLCGPFGLWGLLAPTPCRKLLKKLEQNFYVLLCPGLVVSLPVDTADQTRLQHPPNSMPMNFPAQAPTPHIPCRPISQAP